MLFQAYLAPIQRIPFEILSYIIKLFLPEGFSYPDWSNARSLLRLKLVSRTWKDCVEDSLSLWSAVWLESEFGTRPERLDKDISSLQAWIQQAQDVALTFGIEGCASICDALVSDLMKELAPRVQRMEIPTVRRLGQENADPLLELQNLMLQECRNLTFLKYDGWEEPPECVHLSHPSLSTLSVRCDWSTFINRLEAPRLRVMEIDDHGEYDLEEPLLLVLSRRFPLIDTLNVAAAPASAGEAAATYTFRELRQYTCCYYTETAWKSTLVPVFRGSSSLVRLTVPFHFATMNPGIPIPRLEKLTLAMCQPDLELHREACFMFHLPHLKHLEIFFDWDDELRGELQAAAVWVVNKLVRDGPNDNGNETPPCPSLEMFTFPGTPGEPGEDLTMFTALAYLLKWRHEVHQLNLQERSFIPLRVDVGKFAPLGTMSPITWKELEERVRENKPLLEVLADL